MKTFGIVERNLAKRFAVFSLKGCNNNSEIQYKFSSLQNTLPPRIQRHFSMAEPQKQVEAAPKPQKEKKPKQAKPAKEPKPEPQAAPDPLAGNYGVLQMIQSETQTDRVWTKVKDLDLSLEGKQVLVRARLHNQRVKGNLAFVVLRESFATVQAVAFANKETTSKQCIKFINTISKESIVEITGLVKKPQQEITSCSQAIELQIQKIFVVSMSVPQLPLQLEDAQRRLEKNESEEGEDAPKEGETAPVKTEEESKGAEKMPVVKLKTRLDNRIIDLRTTTNQAIFRISSAVCQLFREFLYKENFIEIHTPKLLGGTSEGGANVFRLDYFGKKACLAQSPQLFKQMCVMSDFDRVFEIGPIFRAENSMTHRHMCEFTGLDLEMAIKEHYFELLDILGSLFNFIFEGLTTRWARELSVINDQYPFEPFKFISPPLKLTFEEGVNLLKENGIEQDLFDDLSTEREKQLGKLVKDKYNTDFYMLHRYPKNARPFYTMLCKDDPNFTCSYDFFMRGEEIISGAQRIHDPEILARRATECGIPVETIKDYIDSFKFGAYPHGGCGVGLERVVMLFCALGNIRKSSLFPRDPVRLFP